MCPFVIVTFLFSISVLLIDMFNALIVTFGSSNQVFLKEGKNQLVNYTIVDNFDKQEKLFYSLQVEDLNIAKVVNQSDIQINTSQLLISNQSYFTYSSNFTLIGLKLGHTSLVINHVPTNLSNKLNVSKSNVSSSFKTEVDVNNRLDIIVTLEKSILAKIFTISVIILVSLNYINLGCAMDLEIVRNVLKKPTAPTLGFFTQYIFMPVLSYVAGYYIFSKDETFYRFGLFAFGCSPGGSASNIWTVLLNGNLNLSLTMTFVSTTAALFMIPIWILTLGCKIMQNSSTRVPYYDILKSLAVMSIFLGMGLLTQRYLPKIASICRKILVPASVFVISIIIVFGTIAYWFIIQMLTWKIIIAAALNVWLGFLFGLVLALLFQFPKKDVIAISIETGLQNTGISIFLIHFSLNSPESDLAFIVPIAASLLTPLPLTTYYIMTKLYYYLNPNHSFKLGNDCGDHYPPIMNNGSSNLIDNQTSQTNPNYKSDENLSDY